MQRVPNELKVILAIIQTDHIEQLEKNDPNWYTNLDWRTFTELAFHHRVFPLLYLKLKDCENVPPNVIQSMEQKYKKNTFNMLKLTAEMARISECLTNHDIRSLFLKGPILANNLYGNLSYRTSTDLDMLIPFADLNKVNEILVNQGYVKEGNHENLLGGWKWREHHVTYFHSVTSVKLEVHWRLNPGPGKEPSFQELWRRKSKTFYMNIPVCHLGKEDLFLFLVYHGARHGWFRLRWLIDIDRLYKKELNWEELSLLSRKFQSTHIIGQVFILMNQLLKSSINEMLMGKMVGNHSKKIAQEAIYFLERIENLQTPTTSKETDEYLLRHLIALKTLKNKVIFYLSCLHPLPIDAETLPLPKFLHFLYFPLRPFLWTWRKAFRRGLT
nr:nucleotidyltransferase family protein [Fredinandcohnia sp. SECRCQ15]